VFVSAQRLGEIFLLIVCFYMDSELRKILAYTSRALRYLTDSILAQCVTGTQELALELGVDGVVRTGEEKKLINPVFILAAIPSSLLSRLLSDLLASTPSSPYSGGYSCFWFCFLSTGQVLKAAATSQSFLTPAHWVVFDSYLPSLN
jgi:hypothetical protein